MAALHYPVSETALLLVDPYNDFLSPGGKLYEPAKAVIEAVGTVAHMRAVLAAVRAAGIAGVLRAAPPRPAAATSPAGAMPRPTCWPGTRRRSSPKAAGAGSGTPTSSRGPRT